MRKLLFAILTLLGVVNACAAELSDSHIELERAAFFNDCVENYRVGSAFTQQGFATVCRCSAARFFQNIPVDVTESLLRGDVTNRSVLEHSNRTGRYCLEWVQNRQLSLPPGTLLTYRPNDVGRGSAPLVEVPASNNPPLQERTLSLYGASCSIDAGGLIRCNNGLTCTRDAEGLIRCNNGLTANTDAGGLTRFNNGSSAITDKSGLTRYSDGTTSSTDSSGLTRFSDGTNCTRDASGLVRCTKRQGLLD